MADLPAPEHPLQAMTAMSNLMLVQTGKFFQNVACGNPKPLMLERKLLQTTGASANNRFHEALDEVEIEILQAKAVFERDLRRLRAKRAEREKAAGALTKPAGVQKHQSPRLGAKKSPTSNDEKVAESVTHDADVQKTESAAERTGDEVAAEGKRKADIQQSQVNQTAMDGVVDTGPAPDKPVTSEPLPVGPTVGLAIDLQPTSEVAKEPTPKPQEPSNGINEQSTINATDEVQANQEQEAAPFESMFNDLENPSDPTSLDFDLAFPSNGEMPQDLLNEAVFDTLATTNNDQTLTLGPTTAEDIDTLLPGLDNYVSDRGDFSILDMDIPAPATEAPTGQNTTDAIPTNLDEGAQQQQQEQQPESAHIESNFDELFNGSGDWGMDDDLGGGTMGDFDDSWF